MSAGLLRGLLVSGAMILAAACGSDSKTPSPPSGGSGGAPGTNAGASCVLNSDCTDPLACVFGKCNAACAETRDCPTGARCVKTTDGTACLLESEAACTFDTDCKDPLVCGTDHQCRTRCQSDADCLATEGCSVDHMCVSK